MVSTKRWRALVLLTTAFLSHNLYAAQCEFNVVNEWNSGFTASVKITNDTGQEIEGWSVLLEYSDGSSINNMWNANLSGSNPYQATNKNYNARIRNDRSIEFGFNGRKGTNNTPAQIPLLSGICAMGDDGNQRPIADASASDLIGTIPFTVDFDAANSTDPEGEALTYSWDFADGSTSSDMSPSHTFAVAGSYNVSLVVNDGEMDSQPATMTVVAEAPQPDDALCEFRISNEWNSGFTSYVKIRNDAETAIDGWTVSLNFPDGSSVSGAWNASVSGSNPYQFNNANYNATIQPGGEVEFGFNSQKGSAGSPAPTPELRGICRKGDSVNTPPIAVAEVSPSQGSVPLTVVFDASGSTDADGDTLSYLWEFEDGSTSTEESFEQTFDDVGSYPVSLTVSDGEASSETVSVTIEAEEFVNTPPLAAANVSPQQGNAPLTVTFDASGSSDADDDDLTYLWLFEDGSTSTDMRFERTFTEVGDYFVSLTVNDGEADSETTSSLISVTEPQLGQAYSLDTANSSLHFVSTKKVHVLETHTFTDINGNLSEQGEASLSINLASVESGIDIRNERMRDHLFEVVTFGTAEVSLSVDLTQIADMAAGSSQLQTISPSLNLHGVEAILETQVRITKLSDTSFMVQNVNPMLVQAADFDLTGGIETLRELAGLDVISYSVPTNFTLIFNAQP